MHGYVYESKYDAHARTAPTRQHRIFFSLCMCFRALAISNAFALRGTYRDDPSPVAVRTAHTERLCKCLLSQSQRRAIYTAGFKYLRVRVHAVNCIKHAAEFLWSLTSLLHESCFCRFRGRMKPEPVVVFL